MKMNIVNYQQSGVDRIAADHFIKKIKNLSASTLNSKVRAAVGGYASLFELDKKRWIAASTDGVGTKLKLAFQQNIHNTVGIDLVAMSVNDLLCVGAIPLFFLDYFATSRLDKAVSEAVIRGIVAGCQQAHCALVGGETAEMPGFYHENEYDLAGFAVGMVEAEKVLPRSEIKSGDIILGLASSGCHSNGFSLIRKWLENCPPKEAILLSRQLLTPTTIYVSCLKSLLEKNLILGLAHITGSGFLNVPRISEDVSYHMTLPAHDELPEIYHWIRKTSSLTLHELATTFNLGIGMVMVVRPSHAKEVIKVLRHKKQKFWELGRVTLKNKGKGSQVILKDQEQTVALDF